MNPYLHARNIVERSVPDYFTIADKSLIRKMDRIRAYAILAFTDMWRENDPRCI